MNANHPVEQPPGDHESVTGAASNAEASAPSAPLISQMANLKFGYLAMIDGRLWIKPRPTESVTARTVVGIKPGMPGEVSKAFRRSIRIRRTDTPTNPRG